VVRVSDQPTNYVLSDAPCKNEPYTGNPTGCVGKPLPGERWNAFRCVNCLSDGRRLDVESRIAVEAEVLFDGDVFDNWPRGLGVHCWVPGTTEEKNDE
jgi:hypothetical protein